MNSILPRAGVKAEFYQSFQSLKNSGLATHAETTRNNRAMKKALTPEHLTLIAAKPVLTPAEAAQLAGISLATLYNTWKRGAGPVSFYIGRCRRITRKNLDQWISAQTKLTSRSTS